MTCELSTLPRGGVETCAESMAGRPECGTGFGCRLACPFGAVLEYDPGMRFLPEIGSLICFIGLAVLVLSAIADSATPTLDHVDTLGLGMAISGAILTLGAKK